MPGCIGLAAPDMIVELGMVIPIPDELIVKWISNI
jgi:hypothetical protein